MSRVYTGQWRALMMLEDETGGKVMMQTEPPADYEDVERYLWRLQAPIMGEHQGLVEGMRVIGALMVEVTT